MTDAAIIDKFLDALLAERNASPHTIAAYRQDLEQASAFCQQHHVTLRQAPETVLKEFLAAEAKRHTARTQARRLSALRQFYKFLVSEGVRADQPARALTSPKLGQALPKSLPEDIVARLLAAAASEPHHNGVRLVAMLELLYATGMRVSELVSLPLRALNSTKSAVLVRGKGRKERLIPLGEIARDAVARWLVARRAGLLPKQESPYMFPSARAASGHMTRQRFFQLIKTVGRTAGIDPQQLSPHVLRHAFATHLLDRGADLRSVQQLLGHSNLATTQIYTAVATQRLTAAVTQHHPLAQRKSTS